MHKVTIEPLGGEVETEHTAVNAIAAAEFLVSYFNDEFNEQKAAVRDRPITERDLYSAIGHVCTAAAVGDDYFSVVFDGEFCKVENLDAPPKPPSLHSLLGFNGSDLNLEAIAGYLFGGMSPPQRMFSHATAHTHLFGLWQARFGNIGDEGEQLSYDAEAFIELFSSNAWRHIARTYPVMQMLGEYDTEEHSTVPDEWAKVIWRLEASSGDWSLHSQHTNDGVLMSLNFSDEGYGHEFWFYLTKG
jgi:hypothetical protein